MSLDELESAVLNLSQSERRRFIKWFSAMLADEWDHEIEADIRSGRFDEAGKRADRNFENGRCKPI